MTKSPRKARRLAKAKPLVSEEIDNNNQSSPPPSQHNSEKKSVHSEKKDDSPPSSGSHHDSDSSGTSSDTSNDTPTIVSTPKVESRSEIQDLTRLVANLVQMQMATAQERQDNPRKEKSDLKINTMTFSGDKTENLDLFLWQSEVVFKAKNVPESLQVVSVLPQLKGRAARHMQSLGTQITDMNWSTFKKKMQETFTPRQEQSQLLDRLVTLRHTKDLLAYTTEFQTIINKLELDPKLQLLYYVKGLKQKTQAEVRCKQPTTLEEAIDLASLFEGSMFQYTEHKEERHPFNKKFFRQPNPKPSYPPRSNYSNYRNNDNGNSNSHRSQSIQAVQTKLRTPMHRNSSRQQGNPNERPKPEWTPEGKPICSYCKKIGHYAKDCRSRQRQFQGKGKTNVHSLVGSDQVQTPELRTSQPLN